MTGANRGIGLELCRLLQARGDEVIATCRRSSLDLERLGVRIEVNVDVTSDESVRSLGQRLGRQSLDLIVNNAGVLERHGLDVQVIDSIRRQFEINTLGTLRITAALPRPPAVRSGGYCDRPIPGCAR